MLLGTEYRKWINMHDAQSTTGWEQPSTVSSYHPGIRQIWQPTFRARLHPAVSLTYQTRVCLGITLCSFLPDTTRVNGFRTAAVVQRINIQRRHATPGLGEVRCPHLAYNATGNETCIAGGLRGDPKNNRHQLTMPICTASTNRSHFKLFFVLWHRIYQTSI
jgi:hypothetical protein